MMERETDIWCISASGEFYESTEETDRDEAIRIGINEYVRATNGLGGKYDLWADFDEVPSAEDASFFIGKKWEFVPRVYSFTVLDRLMEDAWDFADERASDYLSDIPNEQENELEEELTKTFNAWAKRHGRKPNFFMILSGEEIRIADHLDEFYKLEGEFRSREVAV